MLTVVDLPKICEAIRLSYPDGLVSPGRIAFAAGFSCLRSFRLNPCYISGAIKNMTDYAPEGWMTVTALARKLHISKSFAREVLDELCSNSQKPEGIEKRKFVHREKGSIEMHYHPDIVAAAQFHICRYLSGSGVTTLANELDVARLSILKRLKLHCSSNRSAGEVTLNAIASRARKRYLPQFTHSVYSDIQVLQKVKEAPESWKTVKGWVAAAAESGTRVHPDVMGKALQTALRDLQQQQNLTSAKIKSSYAGIRREPNSIRLFRYYSPAVAEAAFEIINEFRSSRQRIVQEHLRSLTSIALELEVGVSTLKRALGNNGIINLRVGVSAYAQYLPSNEAAELLQTLRQS